MNVTEKNISVVLVSSNSTDIYPENTASDFCNDLPNQLLFDVEYRISLRTLYLPAKTAPVHSKKLKRVRRRAPRDQTLSLGLPIPQLDPNLQLPPRNGNSPPLHIRGSTSEGQSGKLRQSERMSPPINIRGSSDRGLPGQLTPATPLERRPTPINIRGSSDRGFPGQLTPATDPRLTVTTIPFSPQTDPDRILNPIASESTQSGTSLAGVQPLQGSPTVTARPRITVTGRPMGSDISSDGTLIPALPPPRINIHGTSGNGMRVGSGTLTERTSSNTDATEHTPKSRFAFVICDLVRPTIVGSTHMNILAIVPLTTDRIYDSRDAMTHPLINRRISRIHLKIVDEFGQPVANSGTCVAVLSFTRV